MESHKRPAGRRTLLPAEADLCNAVGLTEEEYWYFVELTEAYNGKRPEGYELIPDVRNDPVTIIVNIVIGIALSAIGSLLAPKPKSPNFKQPKQKEKLGNLQTENLTGKQRFTPTNNFDSVQELAKLGETIPLVYARKGVRVSTKLIFSQIESYGKYQRLSAIGLVSHDNFNVKPDFVGYAIGDTLLENYTNAKLKIYFSGDGGRISKNDAYSNGTLNTGTHNDQFAVNYDYVSGGKLKRTKQPYFCGARNPSTQTQFGLYAPAPNGMRYKVEFELVVVPDQKKGEQDDLIVKDQKAKKAKIGEEWPYYMAVSKYNPSKKIVSYIISGKNIDTDEFEPWGTEDVKTAVDSMRVTVDDMLSVGEQYMIGSSLVVCTNAPKGIWQPGKTVEYKFSILENKNDINTEPVDKRNYPYAFTTLQRVAIATITNNRRCHVTELGIKSKVYKRLNGTPNFNSIPDDDTQEAYADDQASINLGRINTYCTRISFFELYVRKIGATNWTNISDGKVFAVRGQTPQAQYNFIRINQPYEQYEYRLRPYAGNTWWKKNDIDDQPAKVWMFREGELNTYEDKGFLVTYNGVVENLGANDVSNREWLDGSEKKPDKIDDSYNPYDRIADFFLYDSEEPSHLNGPEHELVYVNEIVKTPKPVYKDLALAAIKINASTEFSNFSNFSTFVKTGMTVARLINDKGQSVAHGDLIQATNLFPEIAYDLLTNTKRGAGELVGLEQVDRERMQLAAKFCRANNFTWDGAIDENQNMREFIFDNAAFCLLDFTILGGRFSLVPSVPYTSDYKIHYAGKPDIKALFTDGNIKDMKVSFLSPEERQLFRAVVNWRQDKVNGFPETRTVSIRLSDAQGGSEKDPVETFDISGFATTQAQALVFAKYALKLRKVTDHGVTFLTTPQAAMNLAPGEYFRLVSEATHTSRFHNGSIGLDGSIQSPDQLDGSYEIIYWNPGTEGVQTAVLNASNNSTTQANLFGVVFTLNNTTTTNRVYKAETLVYAEDGLVEVSGSYTPLTNTGSLAVLQWGSNDFDIETG